MPDYTQETRLLAIETPLGKDKLLLQSLTGTEGISRMFHFHLELLSTDDSIDYKQIVGQEVTIKIRMADEQERLIKGYVSTFAQGRTDQEFTYYEAEVVPGLWFLTRKANCKVFQNLSVTDIVFAVVTAGAKDMQLSDQTSRSYQPLEYCVQYRESDFNFISRLLEHHGIFYYFEHSPYGPATMVIADAPSAYKPCPLQDEAVYDYTVTATEAEDVVTSWEAAEELRTGKYTLTDYNFEQPSSSLVSQTDTVDSVGGNSKFETFDYPGDYMKRENGDKVTKLRMEEEETPHKINRGASRCRAFTSGYRFTLKEHTRRDFNADYLLTEIQHVATMGDSYSTTTGSAEGASYSNRFVCTPASVPFRPVRVTPRPFVQGPQPAVVVGPSGEEIYTDKYGRIKVQFFWDRVGKKDEDSSCWVRVSQPWAGKSWGAIWLPRIGQEVLVDFLEGDPDRPVIIGRLYNADQTVPYKLPDHQTVSTFKSDSSKGGGGYNELRFEDKKGSEQVYMHAQRDMDVAVEQESREHVHKNRHMIVEMDLKELIKQNKSVEVKMNQKEKVGMNLYEKITMNHEEKVGMKFAVDSGVEIHLKAGVNCTIEAGAMLTIKVGGSFVSLNPAGVFISGPMVMINSGGAAGEGSGASPQDPDAPDKADSGAKFDKA